MRTTLTAAILVMAAAAVAACDRHPQNRTAYNNSGLSAAGAGIKPDAGYNERAFAPVNRPTRKGQDSLADQSASVTADDVTTSRKILSDITASSGMKDADVNVTTSNGVVTLAGNARSQDQVAIAMDIARRQPGVALIQSEIQVN